MKKLKSLLAVVFFTMLVVAFIDTSKGVYVPSFKRYFEVGDVEIGWYLLVSSLFYVLGTYVSGELIQSRGRSFTVKLASVCTMLGLLLISLFGGLYSFYISTMFINFGISAIAISINTLISSLDVKNSAVLMNAVHFLFGLGATIMHKAGGILMDMGYDFRTVYFVLMILMASVYALAMLMDMPEGKNDASESIKYKFAGDELKLMFIISLALGLYVAAELQTASWYVNYMGKAFSMRENDASTYSALFFLIFSFGRLFGGFAAEKIGYMKSVTISSLMAAAIYMLGLIMGRHGLLLISFSGLFFSIVFPTVVLTLKYYFKNSINRSSGIVISLASLLNMGIGLMMGVLADKVGIEKAMFIIPLFLIVSASLLVLVGRKGDRLLKNTENR